MTVSHFSEIPSINGQFRSIKSFTKPTTNNTMQIFSLLLALFVVADAHKITPPTSTFNRVLQVRGGGEIGPLDGSMAMQLSQTVATAYVAGSASKFIASKTGGSSTQVRNSNDDEPQCDSSLWLYSAFLYADSADDYSNLTQLLSFIIIVLGGDSTLFIKLLTTETM
jgi:hypothetical protein